uniref:NADH dehydrogenase subunit 6 n=1 Tax=Amphioctopus fangsiao TaxID=515817 RepID=Q2ABG6_AMPFA|nr:NADH dehydrogenase subunit 6 [Amphioctopus fangsiao]AWX90649.1 NADH dehydrogenase subunit 6 [Amphioctopus fangsiao]AWX90684.1 NADH dehydrogenase subunit 6 [Amphioctopus fangsiao]AWX90696.1 NADH dehydrogenase subunit 6 [Amphioctopus fangsiao]AWX90708.1 NADH dehydrogenase subunit 6 [Amphioctopus fangsiao]AWX90720.1 NADH dehydrogenase subunit 6 [Amphioctopus fangsiao]
MVLMMMFSLGFSVISLLIVLIQPLSLGFMIMLVSMFMSVLISFFVYSWYGFMLFLIYVGGLLVMFMYIISLIPNLIFFSKGMLLYMVVGFLSFFMMNIMSMYMYLDLGIISMKMMNISVLSLGMSSLIMSGFNFFCYVFLGMLLLLILISVVKICYYCEGPLRVFKYKYA